MTNPAVARDAPAQGLPLKQTNTRNDKDAAVKIEPPFPEKIYDAKRGHTYGLVRPLGKGGFAKCYIVREVTNQIDICCKAIWKPSLRTKADKDRTRAEVKILKSLDHPNIVKFINACEEKEFVFIFMELCERKSLSDLLRARKLLDVLEYLQSKRIIHRDLKLANIFLSRDMTIRVGDFGLAGRLTEAEDRKMTMCGTPNYIAPEVLFDQQGYSYSVDMWALGIILYSLLVGTPPFNDKERPDGIYLRIKNLDIKYPEDCCISREAMDVIDMILKTEPDERPSFQQVREHPFFQGFTPASLGFSAYNCVPESCRPLQKRVRAADAEPESKFFRAGSEPNQGFKKTHPQLVSPAPLPPPSPTIPPQKGYNTERYKVFLESIQTFREMHDMIKAGATVDEVEARLGTADFTMPNFISKWTDHGQEYGLGYVLADNTAGVLFKDISQITASPDRRHFEYISLPASGKFHSIHFTEDTRPPSLSKKWFSALKYLNHLDNQVQPATLPALLPPALRSPAPFVPLADLVKDGHHPPQLPHITKYSSTPSAKVFRLSTNFIQMNIVSGDAKIILADKGRAIFYIPKDGQSIKTFRLVDVLYNHHAGGVGPFDSFLYKSLSYLKSVLVHFTSKNAAAESK